MNGIFEGFFHQISLDLEVLLGVEIDKAMQRRGSSLFLKRRFFFFFFFFDVAVRRVRGAGRQRRGGDGQE